MSPASTAAPATEAAAPISSLSGESSRPQRSSVTAIATVPPLGPPPRVRRPSSAERVLRSGLRVIAIRRPGVPLVELRLRMPFASTAPTYPARAALLTETMLVGTAQHDQVALAEELQSLGATLSVSSDADRLLVGGAVLRTGLSRLLGIVGEVLDEATYPAGLVTGARQRLIERLAISRSQPGVVAREAIRRRMFGNHPYARELPEIDAVTGVTAAQVRRLHADRVVPAGSLLVLVGDVTPARALDTVEAALGNWTRQGDERSQPPLPEVTAGPVGLVDRPGSVQSSIRLGATALRRDDPQFPAFQLANLIFGGYFSSRLVENIREDKGYTYSPHSSIEHGVAGSALAIAADVSTEVTGAALLEIRYELGRMATLAVTQDELDNVRQYAIGTLSMSTATQAGLASMVSALSGVGLSLEWLHDHPKRLAQVTVEDVVEVAHRMLAPSRMATIVVGDAKLVEPQVAALGPVELA